jgi:formiminotetrahydrofolate cyclodeaminase
MEPRLTDLTLGALTARLASADPTPGGGSASALVGSLGAALGAMVWRLTRAKSDGSVPEDRISEAMVDLEDLTAALSANVDLDASAYDDVLLALRMPRGSEEESAARKKAIEAATLSATQVPLETARLCREVMRGCLDAARLGHEGAVTDAGVGVLAAYAGLNGAVYNVEINLDGLSDEGLVAAITGETAALRAEAEELKREGDELVRGRLG